MNSLKIVKDRHQYLRELLCGEIPYTSVSAVLDKYKTPYNSHYWSYYKGYQAIMEERIKKSNPKFSKNQLERRAKAHIRTNLQEYVSSPDNEATETRENMDALMYGVESDLIGKEELQLAVNDVLEQWKDKRDTACIKGNTYHRAREVTAINTGQELNDFDLKHYNLDNEVLVRAYPDVDQSKWETLEELLVWALDFAPTKHSIGTDYYNELPDGFYPELILWDDEYKVAGTADRVFIETILGERFVDIDDYKTNNSIDKKSFYIRGKGYQMLQPPINHLMDCKHVRYQMQVSIYAYMLSRMGFTVRKVGYHHLNTLNDLPYLEQEAIDVLEDFSFHKDIKNKMNKI